MIAGIDYDSYAVYFAATSPTVRTLAAAFRPKRESEAKYAFESVKRLPDILDAALATTWLGDVQTFYLERGFGASRRSDFMLGRVQGAILVLLERQGCVVNEILIQEWKKKVTAVLDGKGNGNAPKDLVVDAVHAHGIYPLPDQNLYDAAAMAIVGEAENRKAAQ